METTPCPDRESFDEPVPTQEESIKIHVSCSDNLNDTPFCLVQIGPVYLENGYACAYLSDDEVKALIRSLRRYLKTPISV